MAVEAFSDFGTVFAVAFQKILDRTLQWPLPLISSLVPGLPVFSSMSPLTGRGMDAAQKRPEAPAPIMMQSYIMVNHPYVIIYSNVIVTRIWAQRLFLAENTDKFGYAETDGRTM